MYTLLTVDVGGISQKYSILALFQQLHTKVAVFPKAPEYALPGIYIYIYIYIYLH